MRYSGRATDEAEGKGRGQKEARAPIAPAICPSQARAAGRAQNGTATGSLPWALPLLGSNQYYTRASVRGRGSAPSVGLASRNRSTDGAERQTPRPAHRVHRRGDGAIVEI